MDENQWLADRFEDQRTAWGLPMETLPAPLLEARNDCDGRVTGHLARIRPANSTRGVAPSLNDAAFTTAPTMSRGNDDQAHTSPALVTETPSIVPPNVS